MNKNLPKDPAAPLRKTVQEDSQGRSGAALAAGDAAPDFDLPDDAGGRVRLKDYSGKLLVLYFYPQDDTSGCTKEAIDFNSLREDFAKAGAAILGVSADSGASHAKFKAKYNLALALGSDTAKTMLSAYGVYAEKSMYGRKYMGIERTTYLIGRDGKILAIWNKVKVPGHAAAVLDAVRAQ